jgi:hypothetical protein
MGHVFVLKFLGEEGRCRRELLRGGRHEAFASLSTALTRESLLSARLEGPPRAAMKTPPKTVPLPLPVRTANDEAFERAVEQLQRSFPYALARKYPRDRKTLGV